LNDIVAIRPIHEQLRFVPDLGAPKHIRRKVRSRERQETIQTPGKEKKRKIDVNGLRV
jgi:hypothetical protein